MNPIRFIAFSVAIVIPLSAIARTTQWGDLTGRFTYDGAPPPAKMFRVTKDTATFGNAISDDSLVVNKKNRGISNVLVYLLPHKDVELVVHPSYACTATTTVELAMEQGRFVPHMLLLRTSQTLSQRNKDKVAHSAKIGFVNNTPM